MGEEYKVKVGQFEGPLELLLDLIEKRKMHINDISLAEVTDGYMQYIENLINFPTEAVASFITIASTLILIKSISLLPTLSVTPEETEDIEELQERLRILKDIKEKGEYVKRMFGTNIIFTALDKKNTEPVFSPTTEVTAENFLISMRAIIAGLPKKEVMPQAVVKKIISLEEAIEGLIERVQRDLKMSFSKMNSGISSADPVVRKAEKVNVIISFLAVLELVKRGIILVKQDEHFRDIDIESGKSTLPVYS
ncbi:MAG: segregation/condensation protein A [bacterium]|nr:segregation/condensation protein A [bacterium]